MEFTNHTIYDKAALGALNRLAGKSVQKKKQRISRAVCWILGVIGLVSGVVLVGVLHQDTVLGSLSMLYGAIFLLLGLYWNRFQTWTSKRMLMQGVRDCHFHFDENGFSSHNEVGDSNYPYSRILSVAEDDQWFVLFLDQKHGIILRKEGFAPGEDPAAFRAFLEDQTKRSINGIVS